MPSLRSAGGAVALALLLASCGSTGSTEVAPPVGAVTIRMFRYQPERIEAPSGQKVTWTNRDEILHTVTAGTPDEPSDAFDGKMEGVGATFTHIFPEPGEYPYFCSRHNGMTGSVVVM